MHAYLKVAGGLIGISTLVADAVRSGKGFYFHFTHTKRKGLRLSSAHLQSVKSPPRAQAHRTNMCNYIYNYIYIYIFFFTWEGL